MPATSEALFQLLQMLTGLSEADAAPFSETANTRLLTAGEFYIREGDTARKVAYVEKGLVRGYHTRENGEEATLLLRWEGQFVAALDTIVYHRPSRFHYRALEDTTLLEIDYDKLGALLRQHQQFEPMRNFFVMKTLADAMARVESFVLLSPEERYLALVRDKIDIVNRVHDKHLASFLGITPVSLSRIRQRIRQRR
ncbi:Crp/Fnr family transcriptional regulator [Chitinophaga parva]|nr:Crp/Fnr family transcriptional regulator [Chitinophaga parva]